MAEKIGEKLGNLLVKAGLIDEIQLQAALGHQRRWGGKLGKCLVDLGFIEEVELLKFLSEKSKIQAVDLTQSHIPDQAFSALPEPVAKKYGVAPVFIKEGPGSKKTLILAMSDPTDLKIVDEIQFLTGFRVEPVLSTESAITRVLEHYGHYKPEMLVEARPKDVARPFDLKREHKKKPPEKTSKQIVAEKTSEEEEPILRGDEVEEILELEEVSKEGIEIIPDDNIQVIKDEVVMVKAQKPKKEVKVGSSTERIPMRAPTRDKLEKIPEVESYSPPPPPPEPSPEPEAGSFAVPKLSLEPEKISKEKAPSPEQKPIPARAEPIDIGEGKDEEKMEIAPAHEFVSWEPSPSEKAPTESSEMESEEFKPTPIPDLKPEPSSAPEKEEILSSPELSSLENTHLAEPEPVGDDFWKDSEPISSAEPLIKEEPRDERLAFERISASPESIPVAETEEPLDELLPFEKPLPEEPEIKKAPPSNLGSIDELTQEGSGVEQSLYTQEQIGEKILEGEIVETGEMSLEFAFKKIHQLEFKLNELINLMMKKEIGEITTEMFMREFNLLKDQMEKEKAKKK